MQHVKIPGHGFPWNLNPQCLRIAAFPADAISGHGNKKNFRQNLYLTLSDDNLIKTIDMIKFDVGETDIRTKK